MKYILGVVSVVLILLIAIFMIATSPKEPADNTQKGGDKVLTVYETAKDSGSVVFTTEGRLVGDEQRRAIRVRISNNSRTVEILRGYNESVESSQTFGNTTAAYEEFLKALDIAGFAKKRNYDPEDERGVCPTGNRYIYELRKGNSEELRTWATSCSAKQGTFGGAQGTVQQLFQTQIPDYAKFTTNVVL